MNLITITPPEKKPLSQAIAEDLLAGLNSEMSRRVNHHAREFGKFWKSAATPDDILAEMGDLGRLMLSASRENLRNIAELAAMVGKTLDDAISPENYNPPREFVQDEAGSITLAPPADGCDAWGRIIPTPPVQPEPQQEPAP